MTRDYRKYDGYTNQFYGVTTFATNKFNSNNPSLISRMHNQLVRAINEEILLPKIIVVVPDEDILSLVQCNKEDFTYNCSSITDWLMKQYTRIMLEYRNTLPLRSKQLTATQVVWIEAPYHVSFRNNELRKLFNQSLSDVARYHECMSVFQLKKIWDQEDSNFYMGDADRFTAEGLHAYWAAVDKTIKFCDTTVMKRLCKAELKNSKDKTIKDNNQGFKVKKWKNDRYHWNWGFTASEGKFPLHHTKLPTPPL